MNCAVWTHFETPTAFLSGIWFWGLSWLCFIILFWRLWKLLVFYPERLFFVIRGQALFSGMSYFPTWSNHPLNVPLEKPTLLRYCPDLWKGMVLFSKDAVDLSLCKDHVTEIIPGTCRLLRAGEATPSLSAGTCSTGTLGRTAPGIQSCARVVAQDFLVVSSTMLCTLTSVITHKCIWILEAEKLFQI